MNTDTNQPKTEEKKTDGNPGAQNAQAAAANPSDAAAAFAAGGAPAANPNGNEPDPVQTHRDAVEAGRLKKMSEELKAEREKNAELQRKLAEAEKLSRTQKFRDLPGYKAMDDSGRELVDKMFEELQGGGGGAQKRDDPELDEIRRNQAAIAAALAQGNEARAQTDAFAILEKTHPGLLHRIGSGDLKDSWNAFLSRADEYAGGTHLDVMKGALRRGSGAALARLALEFVRDNDLERQYQTPQGAPRTAAAPAAPGDPASAGKPVYQSREEIQKLYTQTVYDAANGKITQDEKAKKLGELKTALEEKRYRT